MTAQRYLLAGDVGGTKTILGLHEVDHGAPVQRFCKTFEDSAFESFDAMLRRFLDEADAVPECVSLAVAGPVADGHALLTNVAWTIDSRDLAAQFGAQHVDLVNDMVALAWALPALQPSQLLTVCPGTCSHSDRIALIAPGTGCGEAFVMRTGDESQVISSEGGHASFAPADALQVRLLLFLRQELCHVSVERVCSGVGIYNIYRFLRDAEGLREDAWLGEQVRRGPDPAKIIGEAGVDGKSELCSETLRLFAAVLAAEAGSMALRFLAEGGVYIGGGIPARVLPFIQTEEFRQAFANKGRFQSMLEMVPVRVIVDDHAALAGAVQRGLARMTAS